MCQSILREGPSNVDAAHIQEGNHHREANSPPNWNGLDVHGGIVCHGLQKSQVVL